MIKAEKIGPLRPAKKKKSARGSESISNGSLRPRTPAQENEKSFVALRHQHRAVESDIASLGHHGLNRCLDVGLAGDQRYAGYGILAYNLHVIGRELQARERRRAAAAPAAA